MPLWPTFSISSVADDSILGIVQRLVLAFLAGYVVSFIYKMTRTAAPQSSFPGTLVLLAILISMITQVIGDNTARAFSLVGALSIVRFRTVVRDTQDTAFVIFAVVVGMAIGAGQPLVALALFAPVALAAWIFRAPNAPLAAAEWELQMRLSLGVRPETLLHPLVGEMLASFAVTSSETVQKGAALEVGGRVTLRQGVTLSDLTLAIHKLEGVQSVSIRQPRSEDI